MQRRTLLIGGLVLIGGSALTGCPGNAPQLDPKYLTGSTTGATGGAGGGGTGGGGSSCEAALPAICARAAEGVHCALSDGVSAFGPSSIWGQTYSDAFGWEFQQNYATIRYPDLDGDGRADVCGRGGTGLLCGLDNGTSFDLATLWTNGFSDAGGWFNPEYYKTIHYADVNGDGLDDVCGRGGSGMFCAASTGTAFEEVGLWLEAPAGLEWLDPASYATIHHPDLDNDGRADFCVRGEDGIMCGLSDGVAFNALTLWSPTFSDADGWLDADQYATIRFPDLNGDHRADVCGRASDGIRCALSDGTTFGIGAQWHAPFSDQNDWDQPQYYETIEYADIDGDGSDDVCGRASDGVYCALSEGTTFETHAVWSVAFSDDAGWDLAAWYSTIRYLDLNGDGRADICGRAGVGVVCGLSTGTGFDVSLWSADFSDDLGFGELGSYATVAAPVLDPGTCR